MQDKTVNSRVFRNTHAFKYAFKLHLRNCESLLAVIAFLNRRYKPA